MDSIYEILNYFPVKLGNNIKEYIENKDVSAFNQTKENVYKSNSQVEEIRLRVNCPVLLKVGQEEINIQYIVSTKDVLEILQRICDNSIYTYQSQICNGYITIKGGHRVGITGSAVLENGQVINISHIYSLNFRVARQIIGSSMKMLPYILNLKENTIYNTIILSPPGRGKTTLLRDCIRSLSNGIKEYSFKGVNIGIVDERGEIGAMYKGVPQNDLGIRTDILDNITKELGMKMLIRSMNPQIIAADEIGTNGDIEAISYAVTSGVKGIFTAHGDSMDDLITNPILNSLYEKKIIERVIYIEKNRNVKLIYKN